MTRHRRRGPPTSTATAAAFLAAVAAGAGFLAVAGACLPELDPLNAVDDAASAPPTTHIGQFCGDGLIQLLDDGGDAGESCDPGDGGATDDGAKSGCRQCQVVCPGGFMNERTNHCYFFVDRTTSYHDALDRCKLARAHVVTLTSADEATFVADAGVGPFWLGLEYHPSANGYVTPPLPEEPGYPHDLGDRCPGCFGVVDEGGTFPLYQATGPDQTCVVASDGRWFKTQCNDIADGGFATLCEREPPGQRRYSCGGSLLLCTTVPVTFGKKRYVLSLVPVPGDQAAQDCKASFGGQLVQLDSAAEREELLREIQLILGPDEQPTVWIGYHRDDNADGGWAWEDGDAGRPSPWGSQQPLDSGIRAFLRISDTYDTELAASDDDPQALHYQLCERPIESDGAR